MVTPRHIDSAAGRRSDKNRRRAEAAGNEGIWWS